MHSLFEKQDSLNAPVETFIYDTEKMPFPVKPHWHYFAEFLYILDGSAEVTCDGRSCTVKKDEFIIRNRHFFEVQPYYYYDLTEEGEEEGEEEKEGDEENEEGDDNKEEEAGEEEGEDDGDEKFVEE